MTLVQPLVIGGFERGMVISPYQGFSQMRGIDPFKVPGVASIERAPTAMTTTGTAVGQVNWSVSDTTGDVYFLDSTGNLFRTDDYSTYVQVQGTGFNQTTANTAANGNGLVYWKGYILVVRDNLIDAYKISNTTWTYAFATFTNTRAVSAGNPAFVGQDDKVYFGNGRLVASLAEATTFDPASGGTFTFTVSALSLPQDYVITCFSELGNNLMIGTRFGTVTTNVKISDVFPWDRDTTHSFSLPIRLNDEGVNSMTNSNGLLYISSGYAGKIYVTNGVSLSLYSSIPLDVREKNGSPSGLRIAVLPDALDFYGEELLVGIRNTASGKTDNPIGVYSIFDRSVRFLGNGSYAKDGSDGTQITISSVFVISPTEFFVAWVSGATQGVDHIDASMNKVGSYGAYMDTEMFTVGSSRQPATIRFFDFYLARDLVSGDGVRIQYRTSLNDSFTTIATMDFATHAAVNTYSFPATLSGLQTIQFRVLLTATSTTSPELRSIIVS